MRLVLPIAALLLAGAAADPAAAQKRFDGVVLKVGTWGGSNRDYLQECVGKVFEAEGGKIEWVIGSPQDNFAKLVAARGRGEPVMDAFEILGSMMPEVQGRNMLAKLDMGKIPNAGKLSPDEVADTAVSTWTTQEMIIYNAPKLAELGIPAPKNLADLKDPRLAGHVMIPDISSGGGIESVGAFAYAAGGDETNIQPGLDLIKSIPQLRLWKAGGDMVTGFKAGDLWAGVAHAGWATRIVYAGVPVKTEPAPVGGGKIGMIKEGWIGIVRGSKKEEAAAFFIDTFLGEDAQTFMAEKSGYTPTNPAARAKLAKMPVVSQMMILDGERIAAMRKLDFKKVDLAKWNDLWNRTIAK